MKWVGLLVNAHDKWVMFFMLFNELNHFLYGSWNRQALYIRFDPQLFDQLLGRLQIRHSSNGDGCMAKTIEAGNLACGLVFYLLSCDFVLGACGIDPSLLWEDTWYQSPNHKVVTWTWNEDTQHSLLLNNIHIQTQTTETENVHNGVRNYPIEPITLASLKFFCKAGNKGGPRTSRGRGRNPYIFLYSVKPMKLKGEWGRTATPGIRFWVIIPLNLHFYFYNKQILNIKQLFVS